MLTTEFLPKSQLSEYGAWLKAQDPETLRHYFGYSITPDSIDQLIKKFIDDYRNNTFLIAKIDGRWAGSIHIATHGNEVEFGVIVALQYRKQGIASTMMDDAITWARNRYYTGLFMHCISWNLPIKRLCQKHGLTPRNMMGDSEANLALPPPTPFTYLKEQLLIQRNLIAKLRFYQLHHYQFSK